MNLSVRWGVAENGEVVEVALRPHLLEELDRRWPPYGLRQQSTPVEPVVARLGLSNVWLIVPGSEESGDDPSPAAWDLLESELALFAVKRLKNLVPVHSATIAWRDHLLVVPGSSGAGKSTLSVAASRRGARVLSDEFTLIDPITGLGFGWNRPVRLRVGTRDDRNERVEIAVRSDPLPIGLLAFVAHADRSVPAWTPITSSSAAIELLNHTICTRTRPAESLGAATKVARSANAVKGTRGEAARAAAQLLEMLDQHIDAHT